MEEDKEIEEIIKNKKKEFFKNANNFIKKKRKKF